MNILSLESRSIACAVTNPRDQLSGYILKRSLDAFSEGQKQRDGIKDPKDLKKRREYIRDKFIDCLGGLPESDAPLNATLCGILEFPGYRIEKIIFESRPNVYVTSNLYMPCGIKTPNAAVLFLCGHLEYAKHADEYQIVCQHLVKTGLIVFAIDPVGQGERISYFEPKTNKTLIEWGTGEHEYAGEQCNLTGASIARYFVHDAMRAVDYLCTRPEVDPAKIGVTGNSGGGTQTSMMMICDKRLAAAAPATFIMDRESYLRAGQPQDAEQIWNGMSAAGFDHEDIILCMAPKPVLVLSVTNDFFPVEAARKTVADVKRVYEICGKTASLEMFEDVSEHKYTPEMAVKAAEFFTLHLTGIKKTPDSVKVKSIDPSDLFCTPEGIVSKEYPDARFAYQENKTYLESIAFQKDKALDWLKGKVYNNRLKCDPGLKRFKYGNVNDLFVEACVWRPQYGILNHAYTFRTFDNIGRLLPVTAAVWDGGTRELAAHMDWIYSVCRKGRSVLVFDYTASGNIKADDINDYGYGNVFGTMHTFATNLFWLNDSICAIRVYDTSRLLDVLDGWHGMDGRDVEFYTVGDPGAYVKLAATIDARIKKIESHGGIKSFRDIAVSRYYNDRSLIEYIIPGILKYMDIGDA